MKQCKILKNILFFIGWILSPLTWWNDVFVNIPLSYLIAHFLFFITHIKFVCLLLFSYWATNVLGLVFMYFGGKGIINSSKSKFKSIILMLIFMLVYSLLMIKFDNLGILDKLKFFADKR